MNETYINKIDPCQPCVDEYGIHDLNGVNNCCFQNCARDSGKVNVWDIVPTECGQKCMACLNRAKQATGRSDCYLRRIAPPPIFVEKYDNKQPSYKNYAKDHPIAFYGSLIFALFILSIMLAIIISVIFSQKK